MKTLFPKFTFSLLFYISLTFNNLQAQETDHLSLKMDFKDSIVSIEAKYRAVFSEKTDSVFFVLNPGFQMDTIISEGLSSFKIMPKEGVPFPLWCLKYDKGIEAKKEFTAVFKYKINLSEQNHMKSDWIELNVDKLWFPNRNALNNTFTYDISINNWPASYTLITHTDAKVSKEGSQITVKKDKPWFEALIIGGKAMKEWKYDENIRIVGRESIPDSSFRSLGDKVKNSIDFLNRTFGKSDPIGSFHLVLRNTKRSEIGFQFNRRNMIISGPEFDDYGNLSHEIAHFWWSKANFIEEPWMNESFANFSMYLVMREFSPEKYEKLLKKNREKAEKAIPVAEARLFAENSYPSYYHKGALHLLSLEEKIGSEKMKKLLSSCIEKNIAATEDFLKEFDRLNGKEQRTYFENLLKM